MHILHEQFIKELQDVYDAEMQIVKALPKMIDTASHDELKMALSDHLEKTKMHITRLEKVGKIVDEKLTGNPSEVMKQLLREGDKVIKELMDPVVTDAILIAAAQKVEHYEIASYGTIIAWAKAMAHKEVVDSLVETLIEEKKADEKLTNLAEGGFIRKGINEEAVESAN